MSNSTTADALTEKRNWVGRFRSHLPGGRGAPASAPKAVPASTYTFREDEGGSSTQASDLDLLMGVGENVHRDIKLGFIKLGESKDKGFADDVVARVAAIGQDLQAVQDHTYRPGDAVPDPIKASLAKLLQLHADLEREEKYYGDKANVTTGNKGQQRTVKTDAVGERRKALDRLMVGKLGPNWEDIAFQATLDMVDTGSDAAINTLVADRAKNDTSMTKLLDGALEQQLAEELTKDGKPRTGKELEAAQAALLRANTGATKVIKAFLVQDKEANDYLTKCDAAMGKLLPSIGKNIELKPSSLKLDNFRRNHPEIKDQEQLRTAFNEQNIIKDPKDPKKSSNDDTKLYLTDDTITDEIQDEIDNRMQGYIGALGRLIDGIMQIPAPKAVAMVAASVATQIRAKGIKDDKLVAKAVGGFIMLRFIAPKLVTSVQKTPEAKQAAMMLGKIVLNSANGITTINKEVWLQPLQDVLNTRIDAMNAWFLDIARQGGAEVR